MASQISKLLLISFLLLLLAYLFGIIGFSTTYHSTVEAFLLFVVPIDVHSGLWKRCVTVSGKTECSDIPDNIKDKDWFACCRYLSVIALVAFLTAVICSGLKLCFLKENKPIHIVAIGATFTSVLCILVSCILLVRNIDDLSEYGADAKYGWSFSLSLAGMGIALTAGVIMMIDLIKANINGKVNSINEGKF